MNDIMYMSQLLRYLLILTLMLIWFFHDNNYHYHNNSKHNKNSTSTSSNTHHTSDTETSCLSCMIIMRKKQTQSTPVAMGRHAQFSPSGAVPRAPQYFPVNDGGQMHVTLPVFRRAHVAPFLHGFLYAHRLFLSTWQCLPVNCCGQEQV